MTPKKLATLSLILAASSLSACSTVKMPNLDFLKTLGFEDDAQKLGDYPDISDTPTAPTDVRSAEQWDIEAKKLMQERDAFNAERGVFSEPPKSADELAREAAALRAKVHAYQADDPQ